MKVYLALFIACIGVFAHGDEKNWQDKMRDLASALSEVIPYLYPNSDKDPKGLAEKLEKLRLASERLDVQQDHIIKNGDYDPALIYLANSFKEDINRAYNSLKEGYPDYARHVLRDSTSYCIACHTRTSAGPEFPLLKAFDQSLKSAPWITRVEFLDAGRQFDAAFDQVMDELKKPLGQAVSAFDLELGARLALSIAIRVKKDPKLALKLVRAIKSSKNATFAMKQAAAVWQLDLVAWEKEKARTYNSVSEMNAEAKRLITRAEKSQSHGHDEVNYLRATAVLHDLLRKSPGSPQLAEAFYLMGVAYSPLQDLGLWNLQEKYFRACIHELPHSAVAEKCYKRFEESITMGYSGSSGIHIPPPMQFQLNQLKNKAKQIEETR